MELSLAVTLIERLINKGDAGARARNRVAWARIQEELNATPPKPAPVVSRRTRK